MLFNGFITSAEFVLHRLVEEVFCVGKEVEGDGCYIFICLERDALS